MYWLEITYIQTWLKIHIRNMVCGRCKMIVKSELEKLGLHHTMVDLGEVEIKDDITPEQLHLLRSALQKTGLELMDDKKSILAEKIKAVIIELVHYTEDETRINHSEYLSERLKTSYTSLAFLFSEITGTTIEQFYLSQKLEKVKELLVYEDLSLTEIAFKMQYSSVAHLSNQFKKMTGLTPSQFRQLKKVRNNNSGNTQA
jgi:AraC-like DNA-binding protein